AGASIQPLADPASAEPERANGPAAPEAQDDAAAPSDEGPPEVQAAGAPEPARCGEAGGRAGPGCLLGGERERWCPAGHPLLEFHARAGYACNLCQVVVGVEGAANVGLPRLRPRRVPALRRRPWRSRAAAGALLPEGPPARRARGAGERAVEPGAVPELPGGGAGAAEGARLGLPGLPLRRVRGVLPAAGGAARGLRLTLLAAPSFFSSSVSWDVSDSPRPSLLPSWFPPLRPAALLTS
ncbi:unnamed protein product, partial [Prorocentrum cordatum]